MNIYNVNQYHPAWAFYMDLEDVLYISGGIKPTVEQRQELKRQAVDEYMVEMGVNAEYVEKVFTARTAAKRVHYLYGTD